MQYDNEAAARVPPKKRANRHTLTRSNRVEKPLTMLDLEKMAEYTDGRHGVSSTKKRARVETTTQRTSMEHKQHEQDTVRTTNRQIRDNVSGKVRSKTEIEQIHERSVSRSVTVECQNEVKELLETFTTATMGFLTALKRSTTTSKKLLTTVKNFVALGTPVYAPYPEMVPKVLPGFAWSYALPLDEAVASFARTWELVHLNTMTRAKRCLGRFLAIHPDASGCTQVLEFCASFFSAFSGEMGRCGFFCSLISTFFVPYYHEIRDMFDENDGDSVLQRKVNTFVESRSNGTWLDDESSDWRLLGGVDLTKNYGDRVHASVSTKRASMKFFNDTMRGNVTGWLNVFVSIRLALRYYNTTDRPSELLKWLPENRAYSHMMVNPETVNPLWPGINIQHASAELCELVMGAMSGDKLANIKKNINLGPEQTHGLVNDVLKTNHYVVVRMNFGNSRFVEAILRQDLAVKVLPLELFSDDSTEESTLMMFSSDLLNCHKIECSRLDPNHFGAMRAHADIMKNHTLMNMFHKMGISYATITERNGSDRI
jgi:hypothetical protein